MRKCNTWGSGQEAGTLSVHGEKIRHLSLEERDRITEMRASGDGLVRWYFPKGTDFGKITDEQMARVESLINNRPRKCLGYKTPLEIASSFVVLRA